MGHLEGLGNARQSRRDVIVKAGVAGAVAWTAPTILSMNSPAAAASGGATPSWLDHVEYGCVPSTPDTIYCSPGTTYGLFVWVNPSVDSSFQQDYYGPGGVLFGSACTPVTAGSLTPFGWYVCGSQMPADYRVVVTRVNGACPGPLTSEIVDITSAPCGQGGGVNSPANAATPQITKH